jgi:AcrR family transcriptional regulator
MSQAREEKKKIILQAATEVLLEYGPYKTTLDDIAKRARMAKTSLYYYFKDKDEIIRAIIQNDMDQLLDSMTRAVDAAQGSEKKLYALVETRLQFISERTMRASKEVIYEFISLGGIFETLKEHYLQAQRTLVEKIFREGIQKGELKPIKNIETTSFVMIASMFGIDHMFAFYDQREHILKGIKDVLSIFFAGLRK